MICPFGGNTSWGPAQWREIIRWCDGGATTWLRLLRAVPNFWEASYRTRPGFEPKEKNSRNAAPTSGTCGIAQTSTLQILYGQAYHLFYLKPTFLSLRIDSAPFIIRDISFSFSACSSATSHIYQGKLWRCMTRCTHNCRLLQEKKKNL